jgi:Domain of unknown function (DUF4397)
VRNLGIVATCASLFALAGLLGCESESNTGDTTTSGSSSSSSGAGGEGGAGGAGGSGGGMAGKKAKVRVAHLAPDAPAVDFCIQADGGAWVGPVLDTVGAADGLPYPNVTKYLELDEATYTARLVDPKATDCNTSLAGLPDIKDIKVTGGESYTLAAIGELAMGAANAFQVKAYVDDGVTVADKIKVRFVHTSPDAPNVDVGLGKGDTFTKIWSNAAYPMEGIVGGKSYVETDPITGGAISVRVAGMSADVLTIEPVDIPAGAIVTAWAIGKLDGKPAPLKALVCVDTAEEGPLTKCMVAPADAPKKKANVRVAHLAPDAPAVDFCIQPEGGGWVGPVLESVGAADGLPYPNVTKYLELDETTYTVRLIDPKNADCNTSLAGLPDIPGIKVTGGEYYTLAAIGELAMNAANKFQVKAFVDDGVPLDGKVKIRFVHTSPDAPNVDVGLGKGAAFTKVWSNVPYPMVGMVGGKSYAETDAIAGGAVSVRVANMSADVLTVEPVDVPAKSIVTAWAIGKLSGNPAPLKALVCVDTAVKGVLTDCAVAP